jgi:hypothetical protein
MPLPPDLGHLFHIPEFKTPGGAGGDTGRFQSLIHTILAVVTLFHLTGLAVPLGRTPGAGRHTGFASHAKVFVDENNAVTTSFLHGAGGAGRHAPRIFTMKTGHENKGYLGQPPDEFRTDLDDLAEFGSFGKILIGLALDFTGMTANAFFGVLVQIIFTHLKASALYAHVHGFRGYTGVTVTKVS